MIRLIITVTFVALFLIISLPIQGVEWIIRKFNKPAADLSSLRIVQWAFRVICFLCGVKLTVIGEEHVPLDEAVLYVPNHQSFFDIVITYARCPGLTGYVAKESTKKVPILSIWMKRLYCLFLDRSDLKKGLKTIFTGIDQMKSGISMCIFPEGTRNRHPEEGLLPFKEGSLKMAEKSGCAIIPIAITGSADILENHFPRIKSAHVIVEYGVPIRLSELSKEDRKFAGSYTQKRIEEMLAGHRDMRSWYSEK
ncbi:MAG: 1-acyl-sn-glycerol-3-phosphate acyltransferase [Lachnospiraceae bacterium]|nr:1-acyl-sn-glycerol-3-phosphate acyltransferase [Lachnospiraceae bacterium]